jgi:hypothetical protein
MHETEPEELNVAAVEVLSVDVHRAEKMVLLDRRAFAQRNR